MSLAELIKHLKERGVLRSPRVEEALRAIDRKQFVPKELRDEAYEDVPLPIGHGATISQPTTVTFMLEKLDAQEGQKVLDIGSGSGWTTALLAHLVGAKGRVIGLEIVPELVALGEANLRKCHSYIRTNVGMRMASAEIRQAKKGVVGLPEEAPFDPVVNFGIALKARAKPMPKSTAGFDRILVSAAGKEIPEELIKQLEPGGMLVIPVQQSIFRIHKKPVAALETEEYPGFVFVPLR